MQSSIPCNAFGKKVVVDEVLVKFNRRLSFKQYMRLKLDKFGIPVWMLADRDNYYVPRFQVYLGNRMLRSVHFGVVVVELINRKCGGIVRNEIW